MKGKRQTNIRILNTTLGSDKCLSSQELKAAMQDCALFVHVPVDGVDCQDGVAAHVAVPVLQARADGRHQRLQQLCFLQLAQEAQSGASDKFVGVLEILKAAGNVFEMPDSPDECTCHLLLHSAFP